MNGGRRRFGFDRADGSGTLTPRPAEVEVARLIFEMAREGKTQSGIARELNAAGYRRAEGTAWTQSTVGGILHDRIWIGQLRNPEGNFRIMEPLIPVELFDAVQRGLHPKGPGIGRRRTLRFLLSNGLLRCGSCGHAMGVWRDDRPDRRVERYRCTGRLSGAAQCKQPHVPREPIDRAVLEYFTQVALDIEGTVAQLAGERDRRLADLDTKLEHARRVQADAQRQLERLDALLREGMTLDEWRRVAAVPASEAEAAAGAIADLTAERATVEDASDVEDATGEFLERMTALRAAAAGEVAEAESIAATQTALRRVFDGFVLHRADAPNAPRRVNAELHVGDWSYVLEPRVNEAARLGTMPQGTPVLAREPLPLPDGVTTASGSRRNGATRW